ncbi:MAG: DEAD/DEAH box helicase [Actinomycetaceae bacterium]|nr:DEAD/DEAH box helicase [Actinomycetaceae bacterium]
MLAEQLLHALEEIDHATAQERLIGVTHIPETPGERAPWPAWLDPGLIHAWQTLGVETPWSHQVQAAEALHAGHHTLICTGTGSGKSLAAWAPALNSLCPQEGREPWHEARSAVLYMAPTKALATDQVKALETLLAAAESGVRVGQVDGDTESGAKAWARAHADVIVTNPDMLHYGILPGHERWGRFLRGLRYIILDEVHTYKGTFGAGVALVLRRLLRLAALYGSRPTIAMLSATMANPEDFAGRLLGVPPDSITVISEDGSARGQQFFVRWQPGFIPTGEGADGEEAESMWDRPADDPWLEGQTGSETPTPTPTTLDKVADLEAVELKPKRISSIRESALVTALFVGLGARVLSFIGARAGAEALAQATELEIERRYGQRQASQLPVAAYRGGYLPEERRELEAAINDGAIRALASTSALELGVDIGGLDAVVSCGFPGTRASLRQQAGRAGRAGASGIAVFVASENPLDQYLAHHPKELLKGVEETIFDPSNPYVLAPQLCAAAKESPLTSKDLALFFPSSEIENDADNIPQLVRVLEQRGLLTPRPQGWFWNATRPENPHQLVDLRGSGGSIQLVEEGTGRILGDVDEEGAFFALFTGAIYVHQGQTFTVKHREGPVITVAPCKPKWRTRPKDFKDVTIQGVQHARDLPGGVRIHFGNVQVVTQLESYQLLRAPGMEIVGSYPVDQPPRTLNTQAVWFTYPDAVIAQVRKDANLDGPDTVAGALHAAEHAMIGMLPLIATCDRWDIGGLSAAWHPGTGQATIFIYDGPQGGAGYCARAYREVETWVEATRQVVTQCPCAEGCPSCIQSPKCGNANEPLHKLGAKHILSTLVPTVSVRS